MPVHEIRYHAWEGTPVPPLARLLAIPKFTLMAVFNKWLAAMLFGIGTLQFIAYAGFIIITNNPEIQKLMEFDPQRFYTLEPHDILRRFLMVQFYLCMIALLIAAPRVISQERAHKGLPLIYSRPVGRAGYIGGKLSALLAILSYLTVLQSVLLFVVMWANYPSSHAFQQQFWSYSVPLLMRALLQCAVAITALALMALAASAATTSASHATLLFLAMVFGASFVSQAAQNSFSPKFPELGVREVVFASNDMLLSASKEGGSPILAGGRRDSGGRILFGRATDVTVTNVVFGILFWSGASLGFMFWRLRPFDIHAG